MINIKNHGGKMTKLTYQDCVWWNKPEDRLHYASYQVQDTQVIIGARPDFYGTTESEYDSIKGWINVSDRFVAHRADKLNVFIPWNEGGQPQVETIFAALKTLDYWVNILKLPKIYLHCDGGTHRAVTLFGFYLLAYHPETAQQINESYKLVRRQNWSNPLSYADTYIKENKIPGLKLILEHIKTTEGTNTHGVSLDDFLKEHVGEQVLRNYYEERFFKHTLGALFRQALSEIKHFGSFTLWSYPKAKVLIYLHKKFNTQKGQFYKKNGF